MSFCKLLWRTGAVDLQINVLTSGLDKDKRKLNASIAFALETKAMFSLNRGLNGPQGLYGRFGEEKNLLPLLKFENNPILCRQ
jgi:hypothetical protein